MNDRAKIKELTNRVDEVLYYLWDPIGVSDEPCARGEYSSYALSILNFVISEDVEKIIEKLTEIESKHMGLIPDGIKNRQIAERLIRDKYVIDEGLR
jgi:hypothetical protein